MTYGMIRVKNEARWIGRVVGAIAPLCYRIFILDDHSTDDTAEICKSHGCVVIPSPFKDFNESRDMQFLYECTKVERPNWIISIDGDEELMQADQELVRSAMATAAGVSRFTLRILYLWDKENQIRVDGVYGNYRRARIFRPEPGGRFCGGLHGGGAGHVTGLTGKTVILEARLRHYGYLHREDRIKKYRWHNEVADPGNKVEDFYRHIVQGDVPESPATAKLKHAGPLTLRPI